MAFCSNCGSPLNDGVRFCPTCGHAVVAADQVPQAKPAIASNMVMRDVAAPAAAGEAVLSTWQEAQPQQANELRGVQSERTADGSRGASGPKGTRRKRLLPRLIGAIIGLAAIAFIALYVVPLFIVHPHDPNEDRVYEPPVSQSESNTSSSSPSTAEPLDASGSEQVEGAETSAEQIPTSEPPDASNAENDGSVAQPNASAQDNSIEREQATPQTPSSQGHSTFDTPTLGDFLWLTGDAAMGNVPAGATRILDVGSITGGWKAYMFGGNMEWLLNANIDVGQSAMSIMLDWFYVHDGATDEGFDDTTPNSVFSGEFDGGMLDATGSGRITLAAFWEQDGHQYATGSFVWPDGTQCTIALVRP